MKKGIFVLICSILAFLVTGVLFEIMSWYHFGDIPTKIVLIRFAIAFVFLFLLFCFLVFFVLKKKN